MANQTLINLKSIYNIENDGTILEILRNLRNSRNNLDAFGKAIVKRKKEIAFKEAEEKKREEVSAKVIEQKPVQEVFDTEKMVSKPQKQRDEQVVERQSTSFNQQRSFNSQNSNRFQSRDRQPQQNGRSNFVNNQQKGNNFVRPQRDGFARNNNSNQNGGFGNKQFNKPQGQGFGANKGGMNFVSTKANSFKTFKPQADFTPPPTPERTFGNKNKTPQRNKSYEQDKKPSFNKKDESRRSVIAYGEDGFEETIMGSRKTIKPKKKQEKVINPIVEHAVLTSSETTVKDLSEKIGIPVAEIVKKLMMLGVMANINSTIDFDTAELVLSDFGVTLELNKAKTMEEKLQDAQIEQDESKMITRPPVVAVMGHVDHGKTSLLDAFRSSNVAAGEAGGITQAIGAYQISFNGEKITFIDTPGHAAFTAMRARGAQATDIAILVVAADDGVMPQTIEAINHIKAAKTPMIVAINKMDKPEANPERIKQQLTQYDVLPEEWGGNAIIVPISAKTGIGLDDLKQTILLVAEMEELKANPDAKATGVVLEAELDKNKGPVATILVQNGTLKVGDSIMSGITYGKVRAMFDEKGKPVKAAAPSTPVSVLGFNEVPSSGDVVYAVEESLSKQVIQERIDKIKKERSATTSGVSLDTFMDKVNEGTLKNLNLIIKADTIGSCEALKGTLLAIRNEEAKVNIIHSGTGAITESDIILADTTKSVIIAFNQKTMPKAKALAESMKLEIKNYNIIYDVVDDITRAINGLLSVKYEEKYIGNAEIRMVFKLSSQGKIAGSYIKDGKAQRGCVAVVKRGEEEIGKTTVESLKIVKDEKSEIAKGFECGIKLKDDIAFEVDDVIEFYVKEKIER